MKTIKPVHLLPAALSFAVACADGPPVAEDALARPAELDAAHEAYLEGDWPRLTESLRQVLSDERVDDDVRDNALALLDRAYEVQGGNLPAGWMPPPGVDHLRYVHVRVAEKDGEHHRINFTGRAAPGVTVTQMRVSRVLGEVLLDRRAGVGTFSSEDESDGHVFFEMESDELPALPPAGVYNLAIELATGERSEGWVIVDRLASGAAPEIVSPGHAAAVSGPNPPMAWRDFQSPDYRPFERRALGVYLIHRNPEGHIVSPWSLWTDELEGLTELSMGRHRLAETQVDLAAGDYCVALTFGESRNFGPVRVVRASRRVQRFSVLP